MAVIFHRATYPVGIDAQFFYLIATHFLILLFFLWSLILYPVATSYVVDRCYLSHGYALFIPWQITYTMATHYSVATYSTVTCFLFHDHGLFILWELNYSIAMGCLSATPYLSCGHSFISWLCIISLLCIMYLVATCYLSHGP